MQIENACVIITGATSGIGKATAALLKAHGAKVFITGTDALRVERTKKELDVLGMVADVSKQADNEQTVNEALAQMGKIDVLINNAGIGALGPMEEMGFEDFSRVFAVNVFGLAHLSALVVKHFKMQNYGNIVNIASTAALKADANASVYAASKFALRALGQSWQAELRKHNVRVITVNPSSVPTAIFNPDRTERPEKDNMLRSADIAQTIVSTLQLDARGFIPEVTIFATNPF